MFFIQENLNQILKESALTGKYLCQRNRKYKDSLLNPDKGAPTYECWELFELDSSEREKQLSIFNERRNVEFIKK